MNRVKELIGRKFLKDIEFLELEDNDCVIECKYIKPHNAHYNEYKIVIDNDGLIEEYLVYLKHLD
ncbi:MULTISPECIES: hypothetical protein [unclassified Romboutsia]|uniref:hypothetical protein n=1 Tax=unclassified Romboutsia TaxID=2626894 RepID=UPI0008205606|nr:MULTISPECIES: hypothetical protein [unclassified Romboutsia]SCH71887.1 Uncharacterised protein [uncultured Clostridium sp.]